MNLESFYQLNSKQEKEGEFSDYFNYMIGKKDVENIYKKTLDIGRGGGYITNNFEIFTGQEKDRFIPRKREVENLFKDSERVSGISKPGDAETSDRYVTSMKKQAEKITEPMRVNRGVGVSANNNSQQGLHPIYRNIPKNVDELRAKTDERKKPFENVPVPAAKKESVFTNQLSSENLTRISRFLGNKALELFKSRSSATAGMKTGEYTLKPEVEPRQRIGVSNNVTSNNKSYIPGVFQLPLSTRTSDSISGNIGRSNGAVNNVSRDKDIPLTMRHLNPSHNVQGGVSSVNKKLIHNSQEPDTTMREVGVKGLRKNNIRGPEKGYGNYDTNDIPTNVRETYSAHNTYNVNPVLESYRNTKMETPDLTTRNTTGLNRDANMNPSVFAGVNENKEPVKTPQREIDAESMLVSNIRSEFNNFYNKQHRDLEVTMKETSVETSRPGTRYSEKNQGYISNTQELGATGRDIILEEGGNEMANVSKLTHSKRVTNVEIRDTLRQNDSENQQALPINQGSTKIYVENRKSIHLSGCKGELEGSIEGYDPVPRSHNKIISKKNIGNIFLREDVKANQRSLTGKSSVKNYIDFACSAE